MNAKSIIINAVDLNMLKLYLNPIYIITIVANKPRPPNIAPNNSNPIILPPNQINLIPILYSEIRSLI